MPPACETAIASTHAVVSDCRGEQCPPRYDTSLNENAQGGQNSRTGAILSDTRRSRSSSEIICLHSFPKVLNMEERAHLFAPSVSRHPLEKRAGGMAPGASISVPLAKKTTGAAGARPPGARARPRAARSEAPGPGSRGRSAQRAKAQSGHLLVVSVRSPLIDLDCNVSKRGAGIPESLLILA